MSTDGLTGLDRLVAEGAALEKEKGETQGKGRAEKSQPRGYERSDFGPLDVEKYLTHYGIPFEKKDSKKHPGTTIYKIQCVINPEHGWDADIQQAADGTLYYHCFHRGCKELNVTWFDAKTKISGDDWLGQFCKNYDPNWTPSGAQSSKKNRLPPLPLLPSLL